MTALSWIFGKKKEEKPVPVTVEAVEIGSDEDYAIIQAHSRQTGLYPQVPSAYPYTPLPYPVMPQRQQDHPQTLSDSVRSSVQNQLEGVPFVLSPQLDQSANTHSDGLEDLRRAVFQIAADINDSMFDYDFKLEHSILREALVYNHTN